MSTANKEWLMKIGELSKVSGLAAHTIRFYESKGLLPKAIRSMNGYRHYSEESIQRLAIIQCAKRLGFGLDSILTIFSNRSSNEKLDHDNVLQQLDIRLAEVESLLKELASQRDEISLFKQQLQETWQQGKCMEISKVKKQDVATLNAYNHLK